MTSLPALTLLLLAAAASAPQPRFVRHEEAALVLEQTGQARPKALAGLDPAGVAARWDAWVRSQDRAVRARLRRGEQDTVVHLLFFGTSFSAAPRLTTAVLDRMDAKAVDATLARRLDDLATTLAGTGGGERIALARSALPLAPAARRDRQAVARALRQALARVQREQAAFESELQRIRALPDATAQVAARSTLFSERGIALDTSLRPAFAVEEALREALRRGILTRGGVRRVAVVGPGLDFVDKAEGQDFYPPQSLQGMALFDSLVRLGLASPDALSLTAFDISPRVLDHLARARRRALAGQGYTLQLPRPRSGWGGGLLGYWERFGSEVASTVEPVRPPATAGDVIARAVRGRPEVVSAIEPRDLDVVYQRLDVSEAKRFDLVVATNILVYYDAFEQALALSNVAAMTSVGGLFLTNNVVPELPGSKLRSVGYRTVVFSDQPDDGEHVFLYRRLP